MSFKQVLASFVHGTVKYFIQIKVVSQSKTRYTIFFLSGLEMYMHACLLLLSTNTLLFVQIQQACVLYKDADPDNKSFGLLHCWNLLQHAQKWKDLPCNSTNKKQKTSSTASPRAAIPGTHESHHGDEEDGPSHTSPRKGRPDG